MLSLVVLRCLFRLMRRNFLGRWIRVLVSVLCGIVACLFVTHIFSFVCIDIYKRVNLISPQNDSKFSHICRNVRGVLTFVIHYMCKYIWIWHKIINNGRYARKPNQNKSKDSNYDWYYSHFHVSQIFQPFSCFPSFSAIFMFPKFFKPFSCFPSFSAIFMFPKFFSHFHVSQVFQPSGKILVLLIF